MNLWTRFREWVIACEQLPWSIGSIALAFGAVVMLRTTLELMVADNPVFQATAAFVHYPLAYVAPYLALTLTLASWSRVAPTRVARLMLGAWVLTLIPPLADALLHRSHEVPTIGYLAVDPAELGWVWAHFFDPRTTLTGTTAGIRIETLAAVLLGFVYVLLRCGSAVRATFAALSVYCVSLACFTLPLTIAQLVRPWWPGLTQDEVLRAVGTVWRGAVASSPDAFAILWLVPVIALLLLLWRRLEPAQSLTASAPDTTRPRGAGTLASAPIAGILVGHLAAGALYLPETGATINAPFDRFALLGALLCCWFGATAFTATGARRGLACAGAGALAIALDRAFALPASAALLALAPIGVGMVPTRWLVPVLSGSGAASGFAAAVAGFALTVGPEGPARVPLSVPLGAAAGGSLLLLLSHADPARWPPRGVIVAVGLTLAGLIWGGPRALAVALPAALLVVLSGAIADRSLLGGRTSGWTIALGTVALPLVASFGLAAPDRRAPLRQEVACVARLERIRGEESMRQRAWGDAAASFHQALACDSNDVGSLRQLGIIARQVDQRFDRALEFFERAVAAAPQSAQELTNLAALYLDLDRAADALAAAERGLVSAPRDPALRFTRARALVALGRSDDAVVALREYLRLAHRRPSEQLTVQEARALLRTLGRPEIEP